MLLMGILVSGLVAFSVLSQEDFRILSSRQFLFALSNIALLSIIFIAVHFLTKKTPENSSSESIHTDELTGFITRHAFGQIFDHIILETRRSLEPLTILLVNIDRFRLLNELYGCETGDRVLFLLSQSIQSLLRASDLTCRWEGDTILIVLKDCTERDGCKMAHKILEKIRQLQIKTHANSDVQVSTSIGVAQMTSGDSSQSLLTRAETGLHSARDNGRNTSAVGYEWILIDYACNPIF